MGGAPIWEALAVIPFMLNLLGTLAHNKCKALQEALQVKKLDMDPQDDVIESEATLQSLGHIDFVKNLLPAQ